MQFCSRKRLQLVLLQGPIMAEVNKPLKDWELSRLAQRMSPPAFEQIAVGYLGLPKVEYIYLLV